MNRDVAGFDHSAVVDTVRLALALAETAIGLAEARNATSRECALLRESLIKLRGKVPK